MFFFFKQKTAYEMRSSDWSSDVCSSDLGGKEIDADMAVGMQGIDAAEHHHDGEEMPLQIVQAVQCVVVAEHRHHRPPVEHHIDAQLRSAHRRVGNACVCPFLFCCSLYPSTKLILHSFTFSLFFFS